jgi:hypothetical protein
MMTELMNEATRQPLRSLKGVKPRNGTPDGVRIWIFRMGLIPQKTQQYHKQFLLLVPRRGVKLFRSFQYVSASHLCQTSH